MVLMLHGDHATSPQRKDEALHTGDSLRPSTVITPRRLMAVTCHVLPRWSFTACSRTRGHAEETPQHRTDFSGGHGGRACMQATMRNGHHVLLAQHDAGAR